MAQATSTLVTTPAGREAADRVPGAGPPQDYPVREYIGAMASELAQMARWDGDEALGRALDAVAHAAAEPRPPAEPIELAPTGTGRSRRG